MYIFKNRVILQECSRGMQPEPIPGCHNGRPALLLLAVTGGKGTIVVTLSARTLHVARLQPPPE